jgi:hypothetical protein
LNKKSIFLRESYVRYKSFQLESLNKHDKNLKLTARHYNSLWLASTSLVWSNRLLRSAGGVECGLLLLLLLLGVGAVAGAATGNAAPG